MLLKDLSPAWPPTSDPSVKPDPQDVIIGAWSKGHRVGRIGSEAPKADQVQQPHK
jgi:hypothetical protein